MILPAEPGGKPAPGGRAAIFALGFRPFYLLAGAYAALGVPLWALQYLGWLPGADPLWHAHEMLFGYAFAVIAGFLLTAVRAGHTSSIGKLYGSRGRARGAARQQNPRSRPTKFDLDQATHARQVYETSST